MSEGKVISAGRSVSIVTVLVLLHALKIKHNRIMSDGKNDLIFMVNRCLMIKYIGKKENKIVDELLHNEIYASFPEKTGTLNHLRID